MLISLSQHLLLVQNKNSGDINPDSENQGVLSVAVQAVKPAAPARGQSPVAVAEASIHADRPSRALQPPRGSRAAPVRVLDNKTQVAGGVAQSEIPVESLELRRRFCEASERLIQAIVAKNNKAVDQGGSWMLRFDYALTREVTELAKEMARTPNMFPNSISHLKELANGSGLPAAHNILKYAVADLTWEMLGASYDQTLAWLLKTLPSPLSFDP